MSAAPRDDGGLEARRSMALGWLSMLPLLAAYEWAQAAQAASGGTLRNSAERALFLALEPLHAAVRPTRAGLVAVSAVAALVLARRRGWRLRQALARIVLEGAGIAIVLGPAAVLLLALARHWLPRLDFSWSPEQAPPLETAALVFGGAAWEELAFRVGAYGLLFLSVRRASTWLAAPAGVARALSEGCGLLGSAALFAAAHLRLGISWLGSGGAEFDAAHFTWLMLAGILLGAVFRLRGPGVAAWAHALFNLGLLVGVDPDVLL